MQDQLTRRICDNPDCKKEEVQVSELCFGPNPFNHWIEVKRSRQSFDYCSLQCLLASVGTDLEEEE